MLSRPFTQKQLKMNQIKHKQEPPQVHWATLTYDSQLKIEQYLVKLKHETVLPSQKHDCCPISADLGNDQFSIRNRDNGEIETIKPQDSVSMEALN